MSTIQHTEAYVVSLSKKGVGSKILSTQFMNDRPLIKINGKIPNYIAHQKKNFVIWGKQCPKKLSQLSHKKEFEEVKNWMFWIEGILTFIGQIHIKEKKSNLPPPRPQFPDLKCFFCCFEFYKLFQNLFKKLQSKISGNTAVLNSKR